MYVCVISNIRDIITALINLKDCSDSIADLPC